MKRKFKLFATLASLCLSVALMAFGVYAATNVTYNVKSTVSFRSQVVGTFSYDVSGGVDDSDNNTSRSGSWALDGHEHHDYDSEHQTYGSALSKVVQMENPTFDVAVDDIEVEYAIYFENGSEDVAALVSVSFDKLFDCANNEQLEVRVGYFVSTSKAAALAGAKTEKEDEEDTEHNYAKVTTTVPTISNKSVAASTGTFCLYVNVKLVNATHKLITAGANQNDSLDITLTVEPAQA